MTTQKDRARRSIVRMTPTLTNATMKVPALQLTADAGALQFELIQDVAAAPPRSDAGERQDRARPVERVPPAAQLRGERAEVLRARAPSLGLLGRVAPKVPVLRHPGPLVVFEAQLDRSIAFLLRRRGDSNGRARSEPFP